MDKGRIKNLIIVVLLLANAFLAAIVLADSAQSKRYSAAAENNLVAALGKSGIKLADGRLLDVSSAPSCRVARDLAREKKLVSSVIGSAEARDEGGNIVTYYGKNGQACFRGTGDFEVLMGDASVPVGSNPAATSEAVLRKLGITIDAGTASVKYNDTGSSCTVTAMCSFMDRPIVNCLVTLNFSDKNLLLISGTCPLTQASENGTGSEIDVSTAVMRLLDILDSSGYVCSEITDISHCYKMDVSASSEGTLTPLWRFATDVGDFYVNGITGKAETVTQNN